MSHTQWRVRVEPARTTRLGKPVPTEIAIVLPGDAPTGNPQIDCWNKPACAHMMSVEAATEIRDALTAAIDEARTTPPEQP